MKQYQIYSRNNDINGNPYRLILTFENGVFKAMHEARSSSPNFTHELYEKGYKELFREIHLQPKEYNSIKKYFKVKEVVCVG